MNDKTYQVGTHVNYSETKLRIKDGLPKLRDLPVEMGGSGVGMTTVNIDGPFVCLSPVTEQSSLGPLDEST